MTSQMDHASNPRARRKARDGERLMHAERQRTRAAAPMTAEQIAARLCEIAPFNAEGTAPVAAEDLARAIAVSAQRRWARNLSGWFDLGDPAFSESIATTCSEFAALHLLMVLTGAHPGTADEAATQIRDAWDDGGMIGELLYQHATTLGIDTEEVSRLEHAWQALPEVQAHRPAPSSSTQKVPSRVPHEIARATLARLASDVPVADDEAEEDRARLRYAVRMLEDIVTVTGEGQ